jgi:hypothetical protein
LAFIAAPVIPALGVAAFAAGRDGLEAILAVFLAALFYHGYGPTLLLGLPLYFQLREIKAATRPLPVMIAGAMIAGLPLLVWTSLLSGLAEERPSGLAFIALVCLLGAFSGGIFWLIAFWTPQRAPRPPSPPEP